MKKRVRRMLCVMMAIVLCAGMVVSASAASEKYTAAVKKYQSFLKKNKGYYEIVDVDQNGIPELIYQNYQYSIVYTYNASAQKMKSLAKVSVGRCSGAAVMYSKKTKTVLLPSNTTHDFSLTVYKINGTKATKVLKAYYGMKYASRSKAVYKINGKKVSKSTYNKKVNKYKKSAKYIADSNW